MKERLILVNLFCLLLTGILFAETNSFEVRRDIFAEGESAPFSWKWYYEITINPASQSSFFNSLKDLGNNYITLFPFAHIRENKSPHWVDALWNTSLSGVKKCDLSKDVLKKMVALSHPNRIKVSIYNFGTSVWVERGILVCFNNPAYKERFIKFLTEIAPYLDEISILHEEYHILQECFQGTYHFCNEKFEKKYGFKVSVKTTDPNYYKKKNNRDLYKKVGNPRNYNWIVLNKYGKGEVLTSGSGPLINSIVWAESYHHSLPLFNKLVTNILGWFTKKQKDNE